MTTSRKPERLSTSDIIRKIIERQILDGDLKPGAKVNQLALSNSFDVSMTIVREALMNLEMDGLVYNVHRKGIFIADFSPEGIRDLFVVRKQLEQLVCDLVIQKATDEQMHTIENLLHDMEKQKAKKDHDRYWELDVQFHNYTLEIASNEYLMKFVESLAKKIRFLRYKVITRGKRMAQSLDYHKDLVKSLKARDVEAARRLAVENLARVENILIQDLNK